MAQAAADEEATVMQTIRILLLIVSALGFTAILFSLALLTVSSLPLRILIVGVGLILLATSIFAWRITAMPVLLDPVQLNAIYNRQSTLRPAGVMGGPTSLSLPAYPAWSPAPLSVEDWLYCQQTSAVYPPVQSPPPSYSMLHHHEYTGQLRDNVSTPPPNYSSLEIHSEEEPVTIASPPPVYRSRMDAYDNSRHTVPEQCDGDFVSVIDCSKAIPVTFNINRSITAF